MFFEKVSANLTTAMFPNKKHVETIDLLSSLAQDNYSKIKNSYLDYTNEYLQICPQTSNQLTEDILGQYKNLTFKKIRFHANLRLEKYAVEAYIYSKNNNYWEKLKKLAKFINMDAYTLHSGQRVIPLYKIKEHQQWLSDLLELEVGVEGLYPELRGEHSIDHWLLSNWKEYQWLLEANIPYVIDCSHIQIVAAFEQKKEINLLKELLANEKCIEIHVSDNDFKKDNHQEIKRKPWWYDCLKESINIRKKNNIKSVLFCESQMKNLFF